MFKENGYELTEAAYEKLRAKAEIARTAEQFGNGRYVRNVYEETKRNQAVRLRGVNLTRDNLMKIEETDISKSLGLSPLFNSLFLFVFLSVSFLLFEKIFQIFIINFYVSFLISFIIRSFMNSPSCDFF